MSAQLSNRVVWAEMARRKVQFHPDEEWDQIKLWGLFSWGAIKRQRESGELLMPGYTRENQTVWTYPSKEAWETKIKPLIEKHSLSELMSLAGW